VRIVCQDCKAEFESLAVVGTRPTRCKPCQVAHRFQRDADRSRVARQSRQARYERQTKVRRARAERRMRDRLDAMGRNEAAQTAHDAVIHALCEDARRQRTVCRPGHHYAEGE
jgi:hypothetical protein